MALPFDSEKAFETYIKGLLRKHVLSKDKELVLFENKKQWMFLLCRNGKKPAFYFLEIRYHKKKHGRLPTGHGKGGGFQPERLSKLPTYFEKNMRWVLGKGEKEGFCFLTNQQIANNLSGNSMARSSIISRKKF
jgi:hypothetical protein